MNFLKKNKPQPVAPGGSRGEEREKEEEERRGGERQGKGEGVLFLRSLSCPSSHPVSLPPNPHRSCKPSFEKDKSEAGRGGEEEEEGGVLRRASDTPSSSLSSFPYPPSPFSFLPPPLSFSPSQYEEQQQKKEERAKEREEERRGGNHLSPLPPSSPSSSLSLPPLPPKSRFLPDFHDSTSPNTLSNALPRLPPKTTARAMEVGSREEEEEEGKGNSEGRREGNERKHPLEVPPSSSPFLPPLPPKNKPSSSPSPSSPLPPLPPKTRTLNQGQGARVEGERGGISQSSLLKKRTQSENEAGTPPMPPLSSKPLFSSAPNNLEFASPIPRYRPRPFFKPSPPPLLPPFSNPQPLHLNCHSTDPEPPVDSNPLPDDQTNHNEESEESSVREDSPQPNKKPPSWKRLPMDAIRQKRAYKQRSNSDNVKGTTNNNNERNNGSNSYNDRTLNDLSSPLSSPLVKSPPSPRSDKLKTSPRFWNSKKKNQDDFMLFSSKVGDPTTNLSFSSLQELPSHGFKRKKSQRKLLKHQQKQQTLPNITSPTPKMFDTNLQSFFDFAPVQPDQDVDYFLKAVDKYSSHSEGTFLTNLSLYLFEFCKSFLSFIPVRDCVSRSIDVYLDGLAFPKEEKPQTIPKFPYLNDAQKSEERPRIPESKTKGSDQDLDIETRRKKFDDYYQQHLHKYHQRFKDQRFTKEREDLMMQRIISASESEENREKDTIHVVRNLMVNLMVEWGMERNVCSEWIETGLYQAEKTWGPSSYKGRAGFFLSTLGKKLLPFWKTVILSTAITFYCALKELYLQVVDNYFTTKQPSISQLLNPDYYTRLAGACFYTLIVGRKSKSDKFNLLCFILEWEFGKSRVGNVQLKPSVSKSGSFNENSSPSAPHTQPPHLEHNNQPSPFPNLEEDNSSEKMSWVISDTVQAWITSFKTNKDVYNESKYLTLHNHQITWGRKTKGIYGDFVPTDIARNDSKELQKTKSNAKIFFKEIGKKWGGDHYFQNSETSLLFSIADRLRIQRKENPWAQYYQILARSSEFPGNVDKNDIVLQEYVIQHGILPELRGKFWQIFAGTNSNKELFSYQSVLFNCKGKQSEHTIQIEKDLQRTFPQMEKYQGDEGIDHLRNVLTAFSWINTDVGYCQSMNFVTAVLLLFMEEEEALWHLMSLVEDLLPPKYYTPCMQGLMIDAQTFSRILEWKLPKIAQHLERMQVMLTPILHQWLLCLFVTVLPLDAVVRIWDIFFLLGNTVLFRVALALFKLAEDDILKTTDEPDTIIAVKQLGQFVTTDELIDTAMSRAFDGLEEYIAEPRKVLFAANKDKSGSETTDLESMSNNDNFMSSLKQYPYHSIKSRLLGNKAEKERKESLVLLRKWRSQNPSGGEDSVDISLSQQRGQEETIPDTPSLNTLPPSSNPPKSDVSSSVLEELQQQLQPRANNNFSSKVMFEPKEEVTDWEDESDVNNNNDQQNPLGEKEAELLSCLDPQFAKENYRLSMMLNNSFSSPSPFRYPGRYKPK